MDTNMWWIILGFVSWFIVGASSFIYWFTKDFDLCLKNLGLVFVTGLMGPISFFIGAYIHGPGRDTILIKQRKK